MFIRPCYRKKNGKRHAYWALMESYRTERGPRQRVVAYLGQLDDRGRLGVKGAAQGGRRSRQKRLFDDVQPQWVEVDAARVRVENPVAFGGPWLALELVRQLGLHEFLQQALPRGEEQVPWSLMALVLVLCRLCEPSSELHIVEHFYAQRALAELLGVPAAKINEQRLYRASPFSLEIEPKAFRNRNYIAFSSAKRHRHWTCVHKTARFLEFSRTTA